MTAAVAVRRPLLAANWKMHLLSAAADSLCERLQAGLAERSWGSGGGPEVVVFPAHPLVPRVAASLSGSAVAVGGQDLHPATQGPHTGDVSGLQLADAGATWVLCGHSERRHDHGEDNDLVGRKVAAALAAGLRPVLCVGETADERRTGRTWQVLEQQLAAGLGPAAAAAEGVMLAYEPVWAIGTGEAATPETAQEAHAYLRRLVAAQLSPATAARLRILYGGSVNPDNAGALLRQPDIDGFLVGGASLDPEKFLAIMEASA